MSKSKIKKKNEKTISLKKLQNHHRQLHTTSCRNGAAPNDQTLYFPIFVAKRNHGQMPYLNFFHTMPVFTVPTWFLYEFTLKSTTSLIAKNYDNKNDEKFVFLCTYILNKIFFYFFLHTKIFYRSYYVLHQKNHDLAHQDFIGKTEDFCRQNRTFVSLTKGYGLLLPDQVFFI